MSKKLSIIKYIKNIIEPRLPSEYQEVEYLESDGTQWIDLGIKYNSHQSIKLKYQRTSMGAAGSVILSTSTTQPLLYFGALGGTTGERFVWRRNGYYEKNYTYDFGSYPQPLVEMEYDYDTDTLYKDGVSVLTNITSSMGGRDTPYESNDNFCLFTTSAGSYMSASKVYYVQIKNENTLVRNLIPCYRKSDNEPGMYDLVNNVFYTNQGTDSFILGPSMAKVCESILCNIKQDGHNLPSQYQEVEFLQSQPSYNTVINTGIKLNQNSKVETKMFTFNNSITFLYGAREAYQSNAFACFNQWAPFGSDAGSGYCKIPSLQAVLIEQSKDGIYIDGVLNHTYGTQTFETPITCTIFNCQQGTIPGSYYKPNCANAKCYYFKIYENNTLVFNGIPCYRKSDNEPGMYDLVTNTFFTNSGTGTFIVGEDIIDKIKYCIVEREVTE